VANSLRPSRVRQQLVVAEPSRHPSRVPGGAGMPPLIAFQPVGGQRPVAFQQAGQDVRVKAVLAGLAGPDGVAIGLGQQVRHGRGPGLPARLEVVDVLQIAEQVSRAPGVQRAGGAARPGGSPSR
jgi:hypothetical protein